MPVYSVEKYKDGSVIGIWEITESEELLQEYCSLPRNEELEMRFITNEQRRKERLAVYLLLSELFNKKIYLGYHENGRPFLQNEAGHISIAHTKRFVCIIYHPTEHVGIDIESATRNFSVVESRLLSAEEQNYLGDKDRNRQLCILWCAKEAMFKRISESGVDFSEQIEVEKFSPRKEGKLTAFFTNKEEERSESKLHYRTIEDHVMTWVVA